MGMIYLTAKARAPALSTQDEVDRARKDQELALQAKVENKQRAKSCDRILSGRKASGDIPRSSAQKAERLLYNRTGSGDLMNDDPFHSIRNPEIRRLQHTSRKRHMSQCSVVSDISFETQSVFDSEDDSTDFSEAFSTDESVVHETYDIDDELEDVPDDNDNTTFYEKSCAMYDDNAPTNMKLSFLKQKKKC